MIAAPDNADGHIWLARVDAGLVAYGWTEDPEPTSSEGMAAALRAVQLDEKNPYSHYAVAITHNFGGDIERGRQAGERAIALSPSFALGHLVLGVGRLLSGQPDKAVDDLKHGLRLNPYDPHNFTWHLMLGLAHYFTGQPVQGLDEARRSLELRPNWSSALKLAAVCQVALGNQFTARQLIGELQARGESSGDLLRYWSKHRPEWMAQIENVLSSLEPGVAATQ